MPTEKSQALKKQVLSRLEIVLGKSTPLSLKPFVLKYGDKRVFVRVTTEKAGNKFWFDVTPRLYTNHETDFLIYACGSTQNLYVFPVDNFAQFIGKASIGGAGAVPNFTIFLNSHEFEPAGQSAHRFKINQFWNRFDLIKPDPEQIAGNEHPALGVESSATVTDQEVALRKIREQSLIIRNPALAHKVKLLHKFRCQLCNETIQISEGSFYAEAHHIKPLGSPHNGPDILSNMLCVCPNCHVKLDYEVVTLNASQLQTIEEHFINEEFVNYHNVRVSNQ